VIPATTHTPYWMRHCRVHVPGRAPIAQPILNPATNSIFYHILLPMQDLCQPVTQEMCDQVPWGTPYPFVMRSEASGHRRKDPPRIEPTSRSLPLRELALFHTICPAGGTGSLAGPCLTPPGRKLALFFRGLLRVRFTITLSPKSTYPSCRSGRIGFVPYALVRRDRPRRPCRPAPVSGRPPKLALFRTFGPTAGTGSIAAPCPCLPLRKLALFYRGLLQAKFAITFFL
jgi:hypothetical protein